MSNAEAESEADAGTGSVPLRGEGTLVALERLYHIPLIGAMMAFMFWVRIQNYSTFRAGEDGQYRLAGVDSWYHWRATEWTVANYPRTMPYEVYTGFPTGNYVGQFGTLFDQIVATVAMIIGLGDPSAETIHQAALITVPIMAALVAIPVYFMAKRLSGRIAGIVAVLILALSPGTFLARSTTGQFQHHVAEVLFMALSILALMVALRVAERDKPIWELVQARDWDELRAPTIYSLLAGAAFCLYLWTWPPAVMLLGIVGIFFAVQLSLDYVRGISPDHVAYVGVVSMAVPTVFMLVMLERWTISSVTSFGLLQPFVAASVGIGCLFMAWLARQWNRRGIEREYYPASIVGIGVVGLGVMWLVVPDIYSTIVGNVTGRMLPFGSSETALTVQEVQPPDSFVGRAFEEFGMAVYVMVLGLGYIVARPFIGYEHRAEHTLIVVWSILLTSMAMTQLRFWYYLILPVAVVTGYMTGELTRWIDTSHIEHIRDVETYQVLVIALVVMVLFVPFAIHAADDDYRDAIEMGEAAGPHGDSVMWEESTHWLGENTPEPGNLYGAGNEDELDYLGVYEYPDGGDHEYPEGAYGVISWWDYGHLITTHSERIPHSNPFQQHARSSSAYLLSDSEYRAEAVLDAIAAGHSPRDQETEELRELADETDSHEDINYVMIDHHMAGGKFAAITEFTGPHYDDYRSLETYDLPTQTASLETMNENYYDTQLASLYLEDADGMDHYRLVHESNDYAVVGGFAQQTAQGEYTGAAPQSFRLSDLIGQSEWSETTEGLVAEFANARQNGELSETFMQMGLYEPHLVSSVKTFERVDGATITGDVSEFDVDAEVQGSVELETEPGRTFTYTDSAELDDDGTFELVVPYATEEQYGPDEGYTNSSVHATDDFDLTIIDNDTVLQANTTVEEDDVVHGGTIEVEFEEFDLEDAIEDELDGNETDVDEEDEETDDGDADDGEDGDDGENDGDEDNGDADDGENDGDADDGGENDGDGDEEARDEEADDGDAGEE